MHRAAFWCLGASFQIIDFRMATIYTDPSVISNPILDFQLRNPTFTELINDEKTEFMYTKFDCFHVELPIIEHSYNYRSCFSGNPVEDHFDLPSPKDAMDFSPNFLLKHNLSQIPHIASQLVRVSPVCLILQMFKMKLAGGEYDNSADLPTGTIGCTKKDRGTKLSRKDLLQEDRKKLVNAARMRSPLVNSRIEEKGMKALQSENRELQNQIQELKQKLLLHVQNPTPMASSSSQEYVSPVPASQ
ncbi:hypothetical protein SPBRAN_1280 [uncultured Candidatus Thioglobus sp.]|nr:hypothetical protein SPBRAN_1280 [uncultured Candidatus Thioglobus sp.]